MTKEYILYHPTQNQRSAPPPFVERAMKWAKATNEISGLIRGILADGIVTESEAAYIRNWMVDRPELLKDSLILGLAHRIERIFDDGIVTAEELAELKSVFEKFTPDAECPTTLPLDSPVPVIECNGKTFCFTGTFVSGKRSWCEDQVVKLGGKPVPSVTSNLNFLVIGSKASGAWRNQTYGRKIEQAMSYKHSGAHINIVCEDSWLKVLPPK